MCLNQRILEGESIRTAVAFPTDLDRATTGSHKGVCVPVHACMCVCMLVSAGTYRWRPQDSLRCGSGTAHFLLM